MIGAATQANGAVPDQRIECLVADDHDAMRSGLAALLGAEGDIRIAAQAADGEQVLALVERRRIDVAVVDVRMPGCGGVDVSRRLVERGSPTRVVIYTGYDDPVVAEECLAAGAAAFVLKSAPPSDLVRAVRAVHRGETFVDAVVGAALLNRRQTRERDVLSPRERQVLQKLCQGSTTADVAAALFLSPATVRDYTESAMRKLEARNRVHAVALALANGMIEHPAEDDDVATTA